MRRISLLIGIIFTTGVVLPPTVTSLLGIILTDVHVVSCVTIKLPSSRLYSSKTEMCCNGTIHEIPGMNENDDACWHPYSCCGSKLYNTGTERCCNPNVYPRLDNFDCCGGEQYNKSQHKCAYVNQYRSRSSYTTPREILILLTEINDTCTLSNAKNYPEEICCDYKIFANPDRTLDCCNSKPYNFTTHVCCGDEIAPKNDPDDTGCCGTEPYNSNTYSCIRGIPTSKLKASRVCDGVPIDRSTEICCPIFGSQPVMTKSESNHSLCCGNQTYTPEDSVCCFTRSEKSEIISQFYAAVSGGDKKCCGTELIDSSRECCMFEESYDPKTQTCCYQIRPLRVNIVEGANAKCCGARAIDLDKEECCGETIIAKPPEGQSECCKHWIDDNQ